MLVAGFIRWRSVMEKVDCWRNFGSIFLDRLSLAPSILNISVKPLWPALDFSHANLDCRAHYSLDQSSGVP